MKRALLAAGLVIAGASAGWAGDLAPSDLAFDEDGGLQQSLTGMPGNPENGVEVLSSRSLGNCVACHVIGTMPDVPFQGDIGPELDGAGERWSEAQLRGIVANAKIMFDGTMMPSFYRDSGYIRPGDAYTGNAPTEALGPLLTAQQIEDAVAYLVTLK